MRQLQLHEYLTLLDGQARTEPPTETICQAALNDAQLIGPILKLSAWTDRKRRVECVANCLATGTRLVHISADWKNCFLILAVPPDQLHAEAYILFDIGAEYAQVRFICPAFDIDE